MQITYREHAQVQTHKQIQNIAQWCASYGNNVILLIQTS